MKELEKKRRVIVSPSILTADFADIGAQVKRLEQAGADYIHCDVMDGHFVPNITFGAKFVADLKKYTALPLDVHLMISRPDIYAEQFIAAGADILTFHAESQCDVGELLERVRAAGVKSGLALSPDTDVEIVEKYGVMSDIILLMSVYPGFGGQKFMERSYERARRIKEIIGKCNPECILEIDGGVNLFNVGKVVESGVDMVVAGNAVFSAPDMSKAIEMFKSAGGR